MSDSTSAVFRISVIPPLKRIRARAKYNAKRRKNVKLQISQFSPFLSIIANQSIISQCQIIITKGQCPCMSQVVGIKCQKCLKNDTKKSKNVAKMLKPCKNVVKYFVEEEGGRGVATD